MRIGKISLAALIVFLLVAPKVSSAVEVDELNARIEGLEKRLASLEKSLLPLIEKAERESQLALQQQQARLRMRKDADNYSRNELQEIEKLYQVANKKWGTKEAQESLQKLVEKYDKANRTGCAILYLGQMSKGDDQVKHLQQAIEDFDDCFYGDGVQVGAYARFMLGHVYLKGDKLQEAEKLFDELREGYAGAIDHRGNLLLAMLPK